MTDITTAADPAAIEIEGLTRSAFIVKGALVTGSVYGALAIGPFVTEALAASGGGDIAVLNFALTLEYLEAAFYQKALTLNLDSKTKQLATLLGAHEAAHVGALSQTIQKLGGKPVAKPAFSFPISNQATFLKLAQVLEDTGVGAYNGAAPAITSKAVLAAAGSIVQVEARHAAAIRLANGVLPAPTAFDQALTKAQVLPKVKPLIKA